MPIISPASSMPVKTTVIAKPIAAPIRNCCASSSRAYQDSRSRSAAAGSAGATRTAMNSARPTRDCTGTLPWLSSGALLKMPRMRLSGHSRAPSQAWSCTSVKWTMAR